MHVWSAIKGTISNLRPHSPLEVQEAKDLLVQYAKDKDVEGMEAILKRNKVDLHDIINTKEQVLIYILITFFLHFKITHYTI